MDPLAGVDDRLIDKDWRLDNLYQIVDKKGELSVFERNAAQLEFSKKQTKRNIILKARQLGFTTLACMDMLDEAIFTRNFNGVIIAHELQSLERIFEKIKIAWKHFPEELKRFMKIEVEKLNSSEIIFNNGSRLTVTLSSRSDTVSYLHVSEFGKICAKYPLKAAEILSGAFPSVPSSGKITIESTAEGETGAFYEMFWDAWERQRPPHELEFTSFFFPWTDDEQYETTPIDDLPAIMREYQKLHNLSDRKISWYFIKFQENKKLTQQEYPITPEEAFLSSGRKLMDAQLINTLQKRLRNRRELGEVPQPQTSGDWVYLKPYRPGHKYGMGVDVSEGVGLDSSACVIMDFTPAIPEVVARFTSKVISPELLPFEIISGARAYGNPIVAIERNNHGHAVIAIIKNLYPNLHTEEKFDNIANKMTEKIGWLSTKSSKPRIIFNFKGAIEEGNIDILDEALLREARLYDHEDLSVIKFDPESTRHFDLFIAAAIAYEMREYVGYTGKVQLVEQQLENPYRITQ